MQRTTDNAETDSHTRQRFATHEYPGTTDSNLLLDSRVRQLHCERVNVQVGQAWLYRCTRCPWTFLSVLAPAGATAGLRCYAPAADNTVLLVELALLLGLAGNTMLQSLFINP